MFHNPYMVRYNWELFLLLNSCPLQQWIHVSIKQCIHKAMDCYRKVFCR